jgi:hypothetical protein
MLRTTFGVWFVTLLVAGPTAAQPPPDGYYDEEGPYEEGPYEGEGHVEPYDQDAYEDDGTLRVVEHGSPEAQAVTAEEGRGFEMGGHILIPFFLGRPDLQPGFGIQARLGWELPRGWTIEGNLGIQANRFDDLIFDDFLTAFWIGAGARYSFLNQSSLVPFVGASVQVSFWAQCLDRGGVCESRDISAGLGVTPVVGVAWEIDPHIGVELGLQATLTFFNEDSDIVRFGGARAVEAYLSPFLGGTYYF